MKVYIILKKFQSWPSQIVYTTGIAKVFKTFIDTMDFLHENEVTTSNFFDIETLIIDNHLKEIYHVEYKNPNGYYNDPKVFSNKILAEKEVEHNFEKKKICRIITHLIY